jgi:hypothetical protein
MSHLSDSSFESGVGSARINSGIGSVCILLLLKYYNDHDIMII